MRRHRARGNNVPPAIETKLAVSQAEKDYSSVGASSERRGATPPPATALEARRARSPRPARARASRRPPAAPYYQDKIKLTYPNAVSSRISLDGSRIAIPNCTLLKHQKNQFQNLTYLFFLPCRSLGMYTPVHFFGPPKPGCISGRTYQVSGQ